MPASDQELPPDEAPAADLPVHARERLSQMRKTHFFTSDLTVNEFLLVKEAGFEPLGLVMGSSIYHIKATPPPTGWLGGAVSGELTSLTEALYQSRDLAMTRMEEEAEALGADGIIGVRLDVNMHAWGSQVAEFMAVGTAVRHGKGEHYRNKRGRPFTSDLTGQDFWTLLRAGYRPVGFVMGNCCYYVAPQALNAWAGSGRNAELVDYTHSLYDARELAIERLQDEAEELEATGIVGVTVEEKEHSWRGSLGARLAGPFAGEMIEFFVFGTAVIPMATNEPVPVPTLVIPANT
ncbi:MAG TPA: heavy metal-binding domain-containing protein [Planctomycetota bacterium]|nr:heavy metal-binding domain-containing protein [Planctomycetota bacterium]